MSFSSDAKESLAREPLGSHCCLRSELTAFLHMAGTISIHGRGSRSLELDTESSVIARRLFHLIKELYQVDAQISVAEKNTLNKNNTYTVRVLDSIDSDRILRDTGILSKTGGYDSLNKGINVNIVRVSCCRRALLRGAFLAAGSVSNPEKSYHFEYVVGNQEFASDLCGLLNALGMKAKITERKGHFVVYLKGAEQISELLTHMSAYDAVLKLEDIRILKGVRNDVNRAVNCESANVDKTLAAAERQVESIRYIRENMGLDKLHPLLAQIAELRLSNPYAPLSELAALVSGDIGKSGVNHRLKKLEKIAEDIRAMKGEI